MPFGLHFEHDDMYGGVGTKTATAGHFLQFFLEKQPF